MTPERGQMLGCASVPFHLVATDRPHRSVELTPPEAIDRNQPIGSSLST